MPTPEPNSRPRLRCRRSNTHTSLRKCSAATAPSSASRHAALSCYTAARRHHVCHSKQQRRQQQECSHPDLCHLYRRLPARGDMVPRGSNAGACPSSNTAVYVCVSVSASAALLERSLSHTNAVNSTVSPSVYERIAPRRGRGGRARCGAAHSSAPSTAKTTNVIHAVTTERTRGDVHGNVTGRVLTYGLLLAATGWNRSIIVPSAVGVHVKRLRGEPLGRNSTDSPSQCGTCRYLLPSPLPASSHRRRRLAALCGDRKRPRTRTQG